MDPKLVTIFLATLTASTGLKPALETPKSKLASQDSHGQASEAIRGDAFTLAGAGINFGLGGGAGFQPGYSFRAGNPEGQKHLKGHSHAPHYSGQNYEGGYGFPSFGNFQNPGGLPPNYGHAKGPGNLGNFHPDKGNQGQAFPDFSQGFNQFPNPGHPHGGHPGKASQHHSEPLPGYSHGKGVDHSKKKELHPGVNPDLAPGNFQGSHHGSVGIGYESGHLPIHHGRPNSKGHGLDGAPGKGHYPHRHRVKSHHLKGHHGLHPQGFQAGHPELGKQGDNPVSYTYFYPE